MYMFLMRDEKDERKKQTNKQGKATQHTQVYMYNNYIHFRVLVRHLEPKAALLTVYTRTRTFTLWSSFLKVMLDNCYTCIVHDVHVRMPAELPR